MDRRFYTNPFLHHQEDPEPTPDNCPDSPSSGDDSKMAGAPSPKKSRKSIEKKVVSLPIGDVDGSKSKGEAYRPSDSWAWRKYGQKPIKGSPYPRGYYRCSSSKGCPARKQVERSRVDPTMLLITYTADHNHPFPTTKHQSSPITTSAAVGVVGTATSNTTATSIPAYFPPEEEFAVFARQPDLELGEDSPLLGDHPDEFGWFADVATTNLLESPIFAGGSYTDADVAMTYNMREEDESLFADLGELPECAVVFRRRFVEPEENNRRCTLSAVPCCGSTG